MRKRGPLGWIKRNQLSSQALADQEPALDSQASSLFALFSSALRNSSPLSLVRPGGVESNVLAHFLEKRSGLKRKPSSNYPEKLRDHAARNAGISQLSEVSLDEFSLVFYGALLRAEIIVTFPWTSWTASLKGDTSATVFDYDEFDPIVLHDREKETWLSAFATKNVLVISPFAATMAKQWENRQQISLVKDLWPPCNVSFMKPPVTFGGAPATKDWFENFRDSATEMATRDFDVALIGAGSYGTALADEARNIGRIGIQIGGGLQLMFGIMGKRWENYDLLTKFGKLENWTRPSHEERPPLADTVDHGAYW